MTDERLRESQRRAEDDPAAAARLLVERLRAGEVTQEQVTIAAWAGDAVARRALGAEPPAGVALVEVAWSRLEQWYGRHAPKNLANLRPGVSKAELEELERTVGVPIPTEVGAVWKRHDGQRKLYDPAFFEFFNLLSASQARETWKMLNDLFEDEQDELPNIAAEGDHPLEVRPAVWRKGWLPFGDENGNTMCVDLDPTEHGVPGQVFVRSNSCGYELLAPDMGTFLARYAHDLDQGKFLTNGSDLFINDEDGREQLAELAEIAAKSSKKKAAKARPKKKVAKKKVAKKKVAKKRVAKKKVAKKKVAKKKVAKKKVTSPRRPRR